jgi:hypothetical protein
VFSPYVILGGVLALILAASGGAYVGKEYSDGQHAKQEVLIAKVAEQAQIGAAEAISRNRPIHQHNQQVLEREIRIVPDYSRCVHSADGLQSVNSALENKRAESAGSGGVPTANTPER